MWKFDQNCLLKDLIDGNGHQGRREQTHRCICTVYTHMILTMTDMAHTCMYHAYVSMNPDADSQIIRPGLSAVSVSLSNRSFEGLNLEFTMTSKVLNLEGNLPRHTVKLIQTAKSWGQRELEPLVAKNWEQGTLPPGILENFQQQCPDLLGYPLPEKYGGKGYDLMSVCHISRTLASIDASFTTALLVQYGLCCESILLCGYEQQKMRFLPSLSTLNKIGCFCLTEPQSGSDASDLRTTAVKVPGGYRISGSKRWIGNATSSEIFLVWARNTSISGNPIMGFIVQRSQQKDPLSIQTTKIEGKISMRMVQNANVEFVDAFCPVEDAMLDHGKCHM